MRTLLFLFLSTALLANIGPFPGGSSGGGGSGTVTSVGLADASTSALFSISGSPVTTSGTLTETLETQSANLLFCGPTNGSAAQPTFRSLVNADFPASLSPSITGLNLSGLTASEAVVTDGSKNLSSLGYSYVATGNYLVQRDSNGNTISNNFVSGATTVVSAGTTTTLSGGSAREIIITGTSTQTFKLPDATTLIAGWTFLFNNNSTMAVAIEDNSSGALVSVPSGGYVEVYCLTNLTSAGTWDAHFAMPKNASYGTSGLTVTGTITSTGNIKDGGLSTAGPVSTDSSGNLSSAALLSATYGGTGVSNPTAHYVLVSEGSSAFTPVSPSTSGYALISNGTSADPSFQAIPANPTVPGTTVANNIVTWNSTTGAAIKDSSVTLQTPTTGSLVFGATTGTMTGTYNLTLGGYLNGGITSGYQNTLVGSDANWPTTGYGNTMMGYESGIGPASPANAIYGAYAGGNAINGSTGQNTLIGNGAGYENGQGGSAYGNGNVALGYHAGYFTSQKSNNNIWIGTSNDTYSGGTNIINSNILSIGNGQTADISVLASNFITFGSASYPYSQMYVGAGQKPTNTLTSFQIQNTGSTGSNSSAATSTFIIAGAQGTGTAAGGDVIIEVAPPGSSGSTPNTLVEAFRAKQNQSVSITAASTTLTGSAGTMVCSEPIQGGDTKVVCYLSGYTDTGTQTYTYPTAFTHTPFAYGLSTAVSGCTATTTTVTCTVTTNTGYLFLEGT